MEIVTELRVFLELCRAPQGLLLGWCWLVTGCNDKRISVFGVQRLRTFEVQTSALVCIP